LLYVYFSVWYRAVYSQNLEATRLCQYTVQWTRNS